MSRIQLALNVDDLDTSIAFYTKLFGVDPAKLRPGYAQFVSADPALKLVLFAGQGQPGTLNHLGIELDSPAAVHAAATTASQAGLAVDPEDDVSCCFAQQRKAWVRGPENDWELYAVTGEAPELEPEGTSCCS